MAGREPRSAVLPAPTDARKARGGSLVEVLVCIALAGVVLVAVAALFLSGRRSIDSADKYRIANALVRDRLEQLLLLRFDDPRLAEGLHRDDLSPTMPEPATGAYPSSIPNPYRRTWRVRLFSAPPIGTIPTGAPFAPVAVLGAGARYDYKRIDVTVEVFASRHVSGRIAARVSAIRGNPAPDEILSEPSPEP